MGATKKGKSDFFELLIESADNTLKAALLFNEAMHGDQDPKNYCQQLKIIEDDGDKITHLIYKGLNKVFITPIDRQDILDLAMKMDDVIDGIEATIARFDYLNISHTDTCMKDFSTVIVTCCQHMLDAFKLMGNKKYLQISEYAVKINFLENEGDRLMREGIREVFMNPTDPYHDFKIKEIYERLEQTTDACEDVANILESIVMRYA